jgi:two-component system KDP operon response regulator KdpE
VLGTVEEDIMMSDKTQVLVIDDDPAIRSFLHTSLSAHGYDVLEAKTGQEGIQQATHQLPDLILLDLGLPDVNGIEVLENVRSWSAIPVMMLSIQDSDMDKILAFEAGADDYLTKPFSIGELMARLRVMLRRRQTPDLPEPFSNGNLEVDRATRLVKVKGEIVQLTPTKYSLLKLLVQHAGKVLTHKQLWKHIRPSDEYEAHVLRVHVSNMRRKLEDDPGNPIWILTEPGVGYRLTMA